MKKTFTIVGIIILVLVVVAVGLVGNVLGWWFSSAINVAEQELNPAEMLEKYEWFVEQANMIKKADADVAIFEQKMVDIENYYVSTYGTDKTIWLQVTLIQYNHELSTARTDLAAIVSNRNSLVQDYNAQSEKFNWAPFRNRSDFPGETFLEYK